MWLYTTTGFFSIVQKKGTVGLTVRARSAQDLDTLRDQYLPTLAPTMRGAGTDYPYRATVSHADFSGAVAAIVRDLHYSNFKSEVARVAGQERARSYSRIWAATLSIEDEKPRR